MFWWRAGCVLGGSAVVIGAFGAHGLKAKFQAMTPPMPSEAMQKKLENWSTAVHYQMFHALALLSLHLKQQPAKPFLAGSLLLSGTLLFSGSIYALVLQPVHGTDKSVSKVAGPLTPVGGLFLIAGWIALAFA